MRTYVRVNQEMGVGNDAERWKQIKEAVRGVTCIDW